MVGLAFPPRRRYRLASRCRPLPRGRLVGDRSEGEGPSCRRTAADPIWSRPCRRVPPCPRPWPPKPYASPRRPSPTRRSVPSKGEERISLFWRVFGGTILSIAALVGITVYQSFAANLNDLRTSINHVNELQASLATKDDLNTKSTSLWAASKDVTAQTADLKTRTALLETQLRIADEERKELNREVLSLRERLRTLELRRGDAPPKANADPMRKADGE